MSNKTKAEIFRDADVFLLVISGAFGFLELEILPYLFGESDTFNALNKPIIQVW